MLISPPVLGAIAPLQLLLALVLADSSGSSSSSPPSPSSTSSSSIVPTKNYIDTISGYDDLSTCAEDVLSTIVRAQSSGCGDGGALTSYSCFCTDSSSHFSSEITSAVSATCDAAIAPGQASSAIRVFDAYCALGVRAGLARATAPSTASATGTATPAASASSTTATATGTATATLPVGAARGGSSSSDAAGVNSAIIAAAVIVPVCAIGLGLMWCFLWRRRRRETRGGRTEKPRELEDMPSREAPPRRVETIRATTEFKWPARIGDASYASYASSRTQLQEEEQQQHRQHQLQHQHQHHPQQPPQKQQQQKADVSEKEFFVGSPTATSFQSSGATLPALLSPEYHISPQPYIVDESRQRQEELKHKYPARGLHQTEPAELPHHDLPELLPSRRGRAQQPLEPQELPAAMPPPAATTFPQELEGSVSPGTPRPPRSRFSYQT